MENINSAQRAHATRRQATFPSRVTVSPTPPSLGAAHLNIHPIPLTPPHAWAHSPPARSTRLRPHPRPHPRPRVPVSPSPTTSAASHGPAACTPHLHHTPTPNAHSSTRVEDELSTTCRSTPSPLLPHTSRIAHHVPRTTVSLPRDLGCLSLRRGDGAERPTCRPFTDTRPLGCGSSSRRTSPSRWRCTTSRPTRRASVSRTTSAGACVPCPPTRSSSTGPRSGTFTPRSSFPNSLQASPSPGYFLERRPLADNWSHSEKPTTRGWARRQEASLPRGFEVTCQGGRGAFLPAAPSRHAQIRRRRL